MPFAQFGYPAHNAEQFEVLPADFICEAIDQTRGWFYTLMAVGTLVTGQSSYRNVLCLGHILDAEGRKMSKHLGSVLEPIPLMDDQGADALRWFMLASGSPWQARRVSAEALQEVVSKVLSTLWSTASFQALYGRLSDWTPGSDDAQPTMMDRWALSRTHATVPRRGRRSGEVRLPRLPPTDRRADRRPLELVRPAFQTAVLGGRTGRAADTAHLPAQRGAHDGRLHAVHHRTAVAGPFRRL